MAAAKSLVFLPWTALSLSDGPDGDGDMDMTEKEEDDDWDFIEVDGEDRNGTKGPSRVVDRYKLAVFRKASTPSQVSTRWWSVGRCLSKESDL